ncbi:MAG: aspartate--tRNA ligase [Candidatus Algichlamydia australiensis]|nr:aspartate--tRNA ligase [Chlamydiales bacterium]
MSQYRRSHTCGELRSSEQKQKVTLCGWVHKRRDHGNLIFIDLRDRYGITQLVIDPERSPGAHAAAGKLRMEWVIAVTGRVSLRKEGMQNAQMATGDIEIDVEEFTILSEANTPPIAVADDGTQTHEETRLRFRYLDMRRGEIGENLEKRHLAMLATRNFLDQKGFFEITTPILGRSTPEGARDYLVPSRLFPGNFFALPQSPQIFKQLLMIGGMDRYFQIAPCFRDEDLRADRQPEFHQIDLEMSFVTPADIQQMTEEMLAAIFEKVMGQEIPHPFKRMTHLEAMERYGSDRPDLRYGMELIRLDDIAEKCNFTIFKEGIASGNIVKALCVKGGASLSRKEVEKLGSFVAPFGLKGLAWMKHSEGSLTGGIAKFFSTEELAAFEKRMHAESGDLLLFACAAENVVNQSLDHLRRHLAKERNLIDNEKLEFVWVTDFPLFSWDEDENRIVAEHHPFTSPHPDDTSLLDSDPLKVRSLAYDVVLNGYELGGGSQRIHDAKLQKKLFSLLKLSPEEIEEKFGFFVESLSYGTPPHAGIALGLDRLTMILCGTDNIRDVIAFPKTLKALDIMMQSPAPVRSEQWRDLHLNELEPKEIPYV